MVFNVICVYRVHLAWAGFEFTTLVVIGTNRIGSCKSNYHTITTTMAPQLPYWVSFHINRVYVPVINSVYVPVFRPGIFSILLLEFFSPSIISFLRFLFRSFKSRYSCGHCIQSCFNCSPSWRNVTMDFLYL